MASRLSTNLTPGLVGTANSCAWPVALCIDGRGLNKDNVPQRVESRKKGGRKRKIISKQKRDAYNTTPNEPIRAAFLIRKGEELTK